MIEKEIIDLTLDDISEIYEDYKKFHSEQNIYLPTKPYQILWHVLDVRVLSDSEDEFPIDCQGVFSELCENCNLKDKCVTVGIPNKIWFHLDSPYITFVRDQFNSLVFDNEQDCLNKCLELYDNDLVNLVLEKLKNEEE